MLSGDRVALAKLITLVENRDDEAPAVMARVHGHGTAAHVLGVTGPPGAGKSTLVDRLIGYWRARGQRVGVVAIDPSSPFSGGAMLGDRIRMQAHFLDSGVFIRSLSSRGKIGGLAAAARDVARLQAAFGKDIVIVETVGVGQNECEIMRLAQTVVVILVPESGDTIQTMKAGLLEVADVFVVNKADRPDAARMQSELEHMLQLRPGSDWEVPVLPTMAVDGTGVAVLAEAIDRHRSYLRDSGEGARRAAAGRQAEFVAVLRDEIGRRVHDALRDGVLAAVRAQVERGELDPYVALARVLADGLLLEVVRGRSSAPER
jgi:LAO/AO transport system kinase